MVIKYITFYYDSYRKNFKDGFYPVITPTLEYTEIKIGFENINGCWIQISEDCIHKLIEGKKLVLDILNDSENFSNTLINRLGYILY